MMKLGDAVHFVAQPIAKTIDLVFRTNLQNCSACAKRREYLNNMSINGIPIHTNKPVDVGLKVYGGTEEEKKKMEEDVRKATEAGEKSANL